MNCDFCAKDLSYGFIPEDGKTYCCTCFKKYTDAQWKKDCNAFFKRLLWWRKKKEVGPINNRFEILDL